MGENQYIIRVAGLALEKCLCTVSENNVDFWEVHNFESLLLGLNVL